ncbi:MAG: hypothetical protein AABW83_00605 [Nanoarchaeota archaeon]
MAFPKHILSTLGFLTVFFIALFNWNLPWRLSFLIGIAGFAMGMFTDRAFRGSY